MGSAGRGAENTERPRTKLARHEDESGRVRLELDEIRNRSSVAEDVTPRSDGYHFSEPSSSPTTHIGSGLRHDQCDTSSLFMSRALPGLRMDDVNEFDDPFRPPYVSTSPNSFLGSVQRHYPGNTDATLKSPDKLATPVSGSLGELCRAREAIAALEQWVSENAQIARHVELDRDSLQAGVTSLREQDWSLETAMIAEKLAAAGFEESLWTTLERRGAFGVAVVTKDRGIRRHVRGIDELRRNIEEYVVPEME